MTLPSDFARAGNAGAFREKTRKASAASVLANDAPYVALDFETADYGADSACALGLARVSVGRVEDVWYSLIRPPRKRVCFTRIHGLTWDLVKDSPSFVELWPKISDFIADASFLVAHNAPFDRRVLNACCAASGIPAPDLPFVCTLRAARRASKSSVTSRTTAARRASSARLSFSVIYPPCLRPSLQVRGAGALSPP